MSNPIELGQIGYNNRSAEARDHEGSWDAVIAGLSAKGSLVGEQLSHLKDFQRNELLQAMNLQGANKELLANLDDEELDGIKSDLSELESAADHNAAKIIADRIAHKIC